MLTFFTTAKAFQGHSGMIQRNALKSWILLHPGVEVILFGDDDGVAEICGEFGLRHEPHVERHPSGMKYLKEIGPYTPEISMEGKKSACANPRRVTFSNALTGP